MAMEPADNYANCEDANRLCKLARELVELMKDWMGLGVQRQRKEAMKMEMAAIRTRMADRFRLAFNGEKKSGAGAGAEAPDHAHDQADGNFGGGGGFGGGCVAVNQTSGKCEHGTVYFNSKTGQTTCVSCGAPGTRSYYRPVHNTKPAEFTPSDRAYLAKLRIALD